MATYEELMGAARKADSAGDAHAAKRFLQLAKESAPKPKSTMQTIKDNIFGDNDPSTMNLGEKIGTALNMAGESLTLGLVGDEASAAVESVLPGVDYEERRDHYRGQQEQFKEEHPVAGIASELAPAAIPGLGTFSVLKTGSGLLRTAKAGGVAALSGGTYAFNEGEGSFEDRKSQGLKGAAFSGGFGIGVPIVGSLMGNIARRAARGRKIKQMMKSAPSLEELRTKADELFKKADRVTNMDRKALTEAAPGIQDRALRKGMDEVLTPQSSRTVDRVMDAATDPNPNMGFRDLDVLRRQAQIPAGNVSNRVESSVGGRLVNDIDDVLKTAAPDTGSEVEMARKMWGQLRRSEVIDEAMYRAGRSASGYENGIRNEVRSILKNPKKRKMFSEDEIKALEAVSDGTGVSNALKKAGKVGIGQGAQSNGLMAMLALKEFGLAVPVIGSAMQKLGEKATQRNAEIARALVTSGAQISDPILEAARRHAIDTLLTRMAGRGGANAATVVEGTEYKR
ncbi:hypothetical protein [uncultured Ruegeria sp.]|uniref:hypothetical protein n=1 Tax=uncultured Ruegeria sp. TaxID=259304 RepID=UPI00262F36FF|nr:hypothetical protein [uncultured Ruegeria sp.]